MISSTFIYNILDLLLDGDAHGLALRPQLDYLADAKYEYTGVGLFVTFQAAENIPALPPPDRKMILDGVSITSPELSSYGAAAILFVDKGVIDCLEIFCYDGEYPRADLTTYRIQQDGHWGRGRFIQSP